MHRLNFIAANVEVQNFVAANFALLYKPCTRYHYKEFPLAMVPVLTFGNAGFRDVNRSLTAANRFNKFSKTTALVNVGFYIENSLFFREIRKVSRIKFFSETSVGISKVLGWEANLVKRSTISPRVTLWVVLT